MTIMYPRKGKTQGHLREIMVESYEQCKNGIIGSFLIGTPFYESNLVKQGERNL